MNVCVQQLWIPTCASSAPSPARSTSAERVLGEQRAAGHERAPRPTQTDPPP